MWTKFLRQFNPLAGYERGMDWKIQYFHDTSRSQNIHDNDN